MTFEAPTVTGKTVAESLNLLGINANSKNQLNAWNFMKIYLSDEVQGTTSLLMTRKSSQQKGLSQIRDSLGEWGEQLTGVKVEFTDQEVENYLTMVQSPEQCVLGEPYMWEIYRECMEPYCKGTDSFENCLEQLRSRLTVYLSE